MRGNRPHCVYIPTPNPPPKTCYSSHLLCKGSSINISDPDIVYRYVIGQKRPSRPMISLRSRSAYLRMFFTTIVAVGSEAYKPRVRFSKAICIIAKYCIDIMIDLVSRVKRLLAFPSFELSLWRFLKIILA